MRAYTCSPPNSRRCCPTWATTSAPPFPDWRANSVWPASRSRRAPTGGRSTPRRTSRRRPRNSAASPDPPAPIPARARAGTAPTVVWSGPCRVRGRDGALLDTGTRAGIGGVAHDAQAVEQALALTVGQRVDQPLLEQVQMTGQDTAYA